MQIGEERTDRRAAGGSRLAVGWGLLLLLVVPAVLGLARTAKAEGPGTPATVADLLTTFDVADQAADIVIALDTSASMSRRPTPSYPGVVAAY